MDGTVKHESNPVCYKQLRQLIDSWNHELLFNSLFLMFEVNINWSYLPLSA